MFCKNYPKLWINYAKCLLYTKKRIEILFFLAVFLTARDSFAEETTTLNKIIVEVSKDRQQKEGVNYLSAPTLNNLPLNSISEALNYLSGVNLLARNSNNVQSDLAIRAGNFQQNTVIFNGVRLSDPQTAHFNLDIPLNFADLESVEVLGSTKPNLASQDSISGAINFTLKKVTENQLSLEALGGSGHTRGGSFSLSRKFADSGTRISYSHKKSDGFQYDTDFDTQDLTSYSNFQLGENEINLFLGWQDKKFGAYDFYTPAKGYNSYEKTNTKLASLDAKIPFKQINFKPRVFYRRHEDKFILLRTNPPYSTSNHTSYMYGVGLDADFALGKLGQFTVGTEFGQDKIDSTNLKKHDYSHESVYFSDEIKLNERLKLTLGNRADIFTKFADQNSPYLNLNYEFAARTNAFLTFKRAFRLPTFTELYYSDPTTIGDANLSQEDSYNYEIGLDKSFEKLTLGSKIFYRQQHNTIEWTKQTVSDAKWKARNLADIDVNGLEVYFLAQPTEKLATRFNYTYIDWRLSDKLGFLPKYGNAWLKHHFVLGLDYKTSFGTQTVEFIYKKPVGRDNWFLTNIALNYNLNKNSNLFFRVENLFNVGYEEIAGIPSPGRWIESGVRIHF